MKRASLVMNWVKNPSKLPNLGVHLTQVPQDLVCGLRGVLSC